MPQSNRLFSWLRGLSSQNQEWWFERQPLPPISFPDIRVVDRPPQNAEVEKNCFYLVSDGRRRKWALFQCPCGCGDIVTLSLQRIHRPHWGVRKNRHGRVNLQPSVWRDIGCLSHFWIHDGRVYWCNNSGTSPLMHTYTS